MTKLKRFIFLILALIMVLPVFSGCASMNNTATLRILHWADYMDETLLDDFEVYYKEKYGENVKVLFEVSEKPEVQAVKIEKGKEKWDIMSPSETVLERLLKQNLLKPINTKNMPNYNEYISPAMKERSEAVEDSAKSAIQKMIDGGEEKYTKLFKDFDMEAKYSVGYMWGNFGIMYNTEMLKGKEDLLKSWDALWNTEEFKGKMMMKNGPRESFSIGIVYVYKDTLNKLYNIYLESGDPDDLNNYKDFLAEAFTINGTKTSMEINGETYPLYKGNDLIAKVEEALVDQKNNARTVYEMDDGKDAMVAGDYAMDMSWNGDAVWAMGETEDPDQLGFAIPDEGSNFWIDSWVIPKYSENPEVAERFIDYLCSPESSVRNMEYVGYTSVNSSEEILKWAVLNGGNFGNPINVEYFFPKNEEAGSGGLYKLTDEEDRDVYYDYDSATKSFTTFAYMGEDGKLYNRENDELISNTSDFILFEIDVENAFVNEIQYPSQEEYDRCGVMLGYSDYNDEILEMWTRVKGAKLPLHVIIGLSLLLAAAVAIAIFFIIKNKAFNKTIKTTAKDKTPPKRI